MEQQVRIGVVKLDGRFWLNIKGKTVRASMLLQPLGPNTRKALNEVVEALEKARSFSMPSEKKILPPGAIDHPAPGLIEPFNLPSLSYIRGFIHGLTSRFFRWRDGFDG